MGIELMETDLIQTVVEIAKSKDQSKKIGIIVMYGSRAKRTHNENSDFEFIAICDEIASPPSFEFVLNKIPVDLWSTTWDKFEQMCRRESYWVLPAGSFATAKLMYSRSEEDKNRYEANIELLSPNNAKKFHSNGVKRSEETFEDMKKSLGSLQIAIYHQDLVQARVYCWGIINSATIILANLNDIYLVDNWGVNLKQIFTLPNCPNNWHTWMIDMATSNKSELINSSAIKFVESCRSLLIQELKGKESQNRIEMLGGTGPIEYANKIIKAILNDDWFAVSYAIHDNIPWIAQDLLKLNEKWDKSGKFLLFNEIREEYDKQKINDFASILSTRDREQMMDESQKFLSQMRELVMKYSKTHHFIELEEVRQFYLMRTD